MPPEVERPDVKLQVRSRLALRGWRSRHCVCLCWLLLARLHRASWGCSERRGAGAEGQEMAGRIRTLPFGLFCVVTAAR